jgi:hypothetical protein
MMLNFYLPRNPPHNDGVNVANSFFGANVVRYDAPLASNNMHYGILHGGVDVRRRCKAEKKTWIHVDHGHIGGAHGAGDLRGYYRFSRGNRGNIYRDPTPKDFDRLKRLDGLVRQMPWRPLNKARFIAYQPPSSFLFNYCRLPADFDVKWVKIAQSFWPEHEVKVIGKGPKDDAFYDSIDGFVSFDSAVAVECLQRGIQILTTCDRSWWPNFKFTDENRQKVFAYLAGRNFTIAEMESGEAFFHLLDNGEIVSERGTA